MKSSKFKLASIILAVVLCLLVLSAPAGAVVQPNSDFYVLDNENVISAETEKYIIDRNLNLVSSCKGAQVCVVVTDSTNGQDIEKYATELFNAWGIGSKTEDNGVLILFLTDDDNYWIMPGIGLERVLTERVLRQIIDDDCEPSFARKDYDSAAKATFIAINQVVCNYYSQDPNGSGDSDNFPNNNGNNYYPDDRPDYNSGSSCLSCGSCLALSCAACGSCGSCSGGSFMGIIIVIIIVFVFFKIIASIGRGGRRPPRPPRGGGFGGGFGGFGPRPPRGGGFGGLPLRQKHEKRHDERKNSRPCRDSPEHSARDGDEHSSPSLFSMLRGRPGNHDGFSRRNPFKRAMDSSAAYVVQ